MGVCLVFKELELTGTAQNPDIESLICSVTVNSEIGPKSCASSQRATAMGEKFPQPASACDKVSNSHTSTGRHQCCFFL